MGDPTTGGLLGARRCGGHMSPPPSAEFQVRFLRDLQRILEEGSFTATYKFALLHALADLCVQDGDDSGDPLPLRVRRIAERFVELYWRQTVPWPGSAEAVVLAQHTGSRAEILRRVRQARARYGDRLDGLRSAENEWEALTVHVDRVVRRMPLWRLQRVGKEVRTVLYDHKLQGRGEDARIVLKPGIGYCFRTFHPLVLELARGGWVRFVRRLNPGVLGEKVELGEFLFGAPRAPLGALRDPLLAVQDGRCFYCGGRLDGSAHVDHFVPWARYPVDLGHNFVVAHDRCNSNKSDHLAAVEHLANWSRRNARAEYALRGVFDQVGMPQDIVASNRITRWAYRQVAERRGLVWVRDRELVPLEGEWETILP